MSSTMNAAPNQKASSIQILGDQVKEIGPAKVRIPVEGSTIDLVLSTTAKRAVLEYAQKRGYHKPGISSQSGAYPVDDKGEIVGSSVKAGSTLRFRNDYDVQGDL